MNYVNPSAARLLPFFQPLLNLVQGKRRGEEARPIKLPQLFVLQLLPIPLSDRLPPDDLHRLDGTSTVPLPSFALHSTGPWSISISPRGWNLRWCLGDDRWPRLRMAVSLVDVLGTSFGWHGFSSVFSPVSSHPER